MKAVHDNNFWLALFYCKKRSIYVKETAKFFDVLQTVVTITMTKRLFINMQKIMIRLDADLFQKYDDCQNCQLEIIGAKNNPLYDISKWIPLAIIFLPAQKM